MDEKLADQQVFNNALFGVRQQAYTRSVDDTGACLYRGPNGLKCGIGWSIPDAEYDSGMELMSLCEVAAATPSGPLRHADPDLLYAVQQAHDDARSPGSFEQRMQSIARDYGLTYTPVA